ncbi:MAG TPA: LysR family transcriptional regulator [Syntrophorhabdales bacterium]|nr:LysR family transcriptional regulator [Syntrophorhabdales bacterium]
MRVAYRIWLDNDGKAFGEGPYRLLKGIEKTGSLRQAAAEQCISYRKAWLILKEIEERLGFHVVERQVGGVSGGGSVLTARGKSLVKRYELFRAEANKALERIFRKHFCS